MLGHRPFALVALYVVGGVAWMAMSALVVASFAAGASRELLSPAAGVVYVAGTGGLLYWHIRRNQRVNQEARREAEANHVRVEELLAFPRLLPFPIVVLTDRGRVRFANPAARELAAEAHVSGVERILPGRYQQLLGRARIGTLATTELDSRAGERLLRWAFYAPQAGTGAIYAVGRDVTEEQRFDERLAELEQGQANGLVEAGIAHDFNNVLLVAQGYAQLLAPHLDADDPDFGVIDGILDACSRGQEIAARLTERRRPAPSEPRSIDLAAEVAALTPFLRHAVPRNVSVGFQMSRQPVVAIVDRLDLSRVLLNLVVNASDAIDGNEGRVTIRVCKAENEGKQWARLTVDDTGPGVAPEALEHIWEPFYTTKGPERGTGLGLPVVQELVNRRAGRVAIETNPEGGARFILDFQMAARVSAAG